MGIVFNFIPYKMKNLLFFCFLFIVILNSEVFSQQNNQNKEKSTAIIIYGSYECHHCIETKVYLKEKKISFVFYDIDKNPEALNEMLSKLRNANVSTSNLGIPVVDKNGILFSNNGDFQEFLKKLE